eukprot:gnl/Chilomastix_caulleri/3829.p1 GENE.gnl/Chilomastix_caulleri/3829~~gnl/Chilomastix_caulleri/3829.p1  ORF type:complete len:75 (+),score=12.46 gnl/Chilomastix_caulleri/3829:132-356(+)
MEVAPQKEEKKVRMESSQVDMALSMEDISIAPKITRDKTEGYKSSKPAENVTVTLTVPSNKMRELYRFCSELYE